MLCKARIGAFRGALWSSAPGHRFQVAAFRLALPGYRFSPGQGASTRGLRLRDRVSPGFAFVILSGMGWNPKVRAFLDRLAPGAAQARRAQKKRRHEQQAARAGRPVTQTTSDFVSAGLTAFTSGINTP